MFALGLDDMLKVLVLCWSNKRVTVASLPVFSAGGGGAVGGGVHRALFPGDAGWGGGVGVVHPIQRSPFSKRQPTARADQPPGPRWRQRPGCGGEFITFTIGYRENSCFCHKNKRTPEDGVLSADIIPTHYKKNSLQMKTIICSVFRCVCLKEW